LAEAAAAYRQKKKERRARCEKLPDGLMSRRGESIERPDGGASKSEMSPAAPPLIRKSLVLRSGGAFFPARKELERHRRARKEIAEKYFGGQKKHLAP